MYSLKILQAQLDQYTAATGRELKFYSLRASLQRQAHLETLYDYDTKRQLRPLDDEERAFVHNELTMSKLHAPYWLERYANIKPSSGRKQLIEPNFTQQVLLLLIAEMEEQNIPILLQLLKLRQLGCSTIIQLLIAHRVLFYTGVDALVGSNDPDKTMKLLNQYAGFCYRHLPWWMCQEVDNGGSLLIRTSGEVYAEFLNNNSAISWQHGTQTSGMARGGNPQIAHLTELPDFADPKKLVEGSLMNAIHEDSFTLFVLESTAAGENDWWHQFWKANEKLWSSGIARFRPVFLPWYLGKDVWPPPGWVKDRTQRGILAQYKPSPLVLAHAERAHKYVQSKAHLRKVLGDSWKMPLEQMAYWDFSRQYAIEMDSVDIWLQEVGAADAEECFQSGGKGIFTHEIILQHRSTLPPLEAVYGIESEHIKLENRRFPERDRDPRQEPVELSIQGEKSTFTSRLVPLLVPNYPECDPNGKLFVWEPPREGYTYSVVYDAAGGRGNGDNACIEVIRHATPFEKAAQVAEWAANTFTYHDAWPVLLSVALWYSKFYQRGEHCEITIELRHNGNEVQDELHRRGWTNFYKRYAVTRQGKTFEGHGWNTSVATRPKMIDTLIQAVDEFWVQLASPWALGEIRSMGKFTTNTGKMKIEGAPGQRDDRAITLAIGLVVSLGDVNPTSDNSVVKRLLANLRTRAQTRAIKPSQSARGEKNLLSFGSPVTMAPQESEAEVFASPTRQSNLWN